MDSNIKKYLDRIVIFIEDSDFKRAEEYCEKILDIDASNGTVYYYKLLIENSCKSVDDLIEKSINIDKSINYPKIIKFADDSIVSKIEEAKATIYENSKKQIEDRLYKLKNSNSIIDIQNTLKKYESEYSDNLNDTLINSIKEHINTLQKTKKNKYKIVFISLIAIFVLIVSSYIIYEKFVVCKHIETYVSDPYIDKYDVFIDTKCLKCDEVLQTVRVSEAKYILNQETYDNDLDIKFTKIICDGLAMHLCYEINYYGDYADSFDIEMKYDGKEIDTHVGQHFSWGKTITSDRLIEGGTAISLGTSISEGNPFIMGDQNHVIEYTYHLYKINERARGTTDFRKTIAIGTYTFNTKDYIDSQFSFEEVNIK